MSIEIKIGKRIKDFIIEKILNTKKLILISPWISEETAKLLLDLASKNVEITLITSNDSSEFHRKGLKSLIGVERKVKKEGNKIFSTLGIFLIFLGIFLIPFNILGIFLVPLGIFLFLKYRIIFEEIYFSKIKELIITKEKLHAKIIITDNLIGIGSPNFTYSGLISNIESFAWIEEKEVYNKVIEEINRLKSFWEKDIDYRSIAKNLK